MVNPALPDLVASVGDTRGKSLVWCFPETKTNLMNV